MQRMRRLMARMKDKLAGLVDEREGDPRLDRAGGDAGDGEAQPRHMGRRRDRRRHRRRIAAAPDEGDVVRHGIPDRWSALGARGLDRGKRRQLLVIRHHRLGRGLRCLAGLRHHQCHRLAHIAHALTGKERARRAQRRAAVGARQLDAADGIGDTVGGEIR